MADENRDKFLSVIDSMESADEIKGFMESLTPDQAAKAKEWLGGAKAESAAAGPEPLGIKRAPSFAEKARQQVFRIPQYAGELAGEAAAFTPVGRAASLPAKAVQYGVGRGAAVTGAGLGGGIGRAVGEAQKGMLEGEEGTMKSLQRASMMAGNLAFLGPLALPVAGAIEYFAEKSEEPGGVTYDPVQTETMEEAFTRGGEEGMIGGLLGTGVGDIAGAGARAAKAGVAQASEPFKAARRLAEAPEEAIAGPGQEIATQMIPGMRRRAPQETGEAVASSLITGGTTFNPISKEVLGAHMNKVARAAEDAYDEVVLKRVDALQLPPAEAAQQIIAGYRSLRDSVRQPLSDTYDLLVKNNEDTPIDFKNLREMMAEDPLLSSMKGLDELLGSNAPLTGQGNNTLRLLVQKSDNLQGSLPYPEAKILLDGLRSTLRQAKNTGNWSPTKVGHMKLEDAIDEDLHESLMRYSKALPEGFEINGRQFGPDETSEALRFLDTQYKAFKERFDVKTIKDMINADAPGAAVHKLFDPAKAEITEKVAGALPRQDFNKAVRAFWERKAKDARFLREASGMPRKDPDPLAKDTQLAESWFQLEESQKKIMYPDAEHRQMVDDVFTVIGGARPHEAAAALTGKGLDLMEKGKLTGSAGTILGATGIAGGLGAAVAGPAGASVAATATALTVTFGPTVIAELMMTKTGTNALLGAARTIRRIERTAPISATQTMMITNQVMRAIEEERQRQPNSPLSSIPDVTVRPLGADDDTELVPEGDPEEGPVVP